MLMRNEFSFVLPRGYIDSEENAHKTGIMRLATALDEIEAMINPKVKNRPDYIQVILLSRVITKLGTLPAITPDIIEGLFTADFTFLQHFYEKINSLEDLAPYGTTCPHCGQKIEIPINSIFTED